MELHALPKTKSELVFPRTLSNGYPDTALDDSLSDGVARETGDVMDVKFGHEMLSMFVNGFEAHAQFRGNLFVGLAFGNQLEHLHLARTQTVDFLPGLSPPLGRLRIATGETLGNGRAEKCVSPLHLANRLD